MRHATLLAAIAALAAGGLPACGARQMPVLEPGAPPPPVPPPAASSQFQVVAPPGEPEPPRVAPLPLPPLRTAVIVRETLDGVEVGDDTVTEGIVAGEVLSLDRAAPPGPAESAARLEIVNRSVVEKALGRDLQALKTRKRDVDAEVLANLAREGVDLLIVGEIGTSGLDPVNVAGTPRAREHSSEASISIVSVDQGTVLGAGSSSARRAAAVEAKRESARAAAAVALRSFRERPGEPAALVTLTVEGLRAHADAAAIEKALRSTRGILWVKPPRFQLATEGTSVARFELGWRGPAEDLRPLLDELRPGFRLTGTIFEGNRLTYRAGNFSAEEGGQP